MSTYVVRSLVGEKLEFPGRPLLREWCVLEVPAALMTGDLRARVLELKAARKVDVHVVVTRAPVDQSETISAPPKVELPAPTGASGVGLA